MQYWVFFQGGAGGDGFVNLLDHAENVEPADGIKRWRTIEVSNGKIKFYHPEWVTDQKLFRRDEGFNPFVVKPNEYYMKLIFNGTNTVIGAHPTLNYSTIVEKHPFRKIFTRDLHKILLYSNDKDRMLSDFLDKNPNPAFPKDHYRELYQRLDIIKFIETKYPPGFIDTIIDIEKAWRDWDYLNYMLTAIGINLSKTVYEEYLAVAKRP